MFQAAITKSPQRWHQQHKCMASQFFGRSVPSELEEGTCATFPLELSLDVLSQKDTVIPDGACPNERLERVTSAMSRLQNRVVFLGPMSFDIYMCGLW